MKKIFLLLLMTPLFLVPLFGQEAAPSGSYILSYSNGIKPSDTKDMFFWFDGDFAPCIVIDDELQMAGSTITHIEPCLLIPEGESRPGKVFVASAKTGNMLYEQEVKAFTYGYNRIALEKSFEVKAGDQLLVGYSIHLNLLEDGYTERFLAVNQDPATPHNHRAAAYMLEGKLKYSDDYYGPQGVWALNIICKLPKSTQGGDARVLSQGFATKQSYVTTSGEELSFSTQLQNLGTEPIKSLTYRLTGLQEKPVEVTLTATKMPAVELPVGYNKELKLKVPITRSGDYSFEITKVNGKPNTFPNVSNKGTVMLYDKKLQSTLPKRQPLVEYFAGEWVPFMGYGEDYLDEVEKKMKEQRIDYNLYAVHVSFHSPTDPDIDPFETPAGILINEATGANKAFPNVALDRIPFEGVLAFSTKELQKRLEKIFADTYSFWDFKLQVDKDPKDPKKMTAYVDIKQLADPMLDDLVLSLSLVEDKVPPVKQTNAREGYLHRSVLRESINGDKGEPLTLVDGAFRKKYEFTVDSLYSGDIANIKVVAVIARPLINAPLSSKGVLDSRMVNYSSFTTGVSKPTGDATAHYQVQVIDGEIKVSGDFQTVEVLDIAGQPVGLRPGVAGVYLVRIQDQGAYYVTKVLIP